MRRGEKAGARHHPDHVQELPFSLREKRVMFEKPDFLNMINPSCTEIAEK
jgi:hypothetical protein